MKHFMLDTNVVVDFLTDRQPFSVDAAQLFNHAACSRVKLYISVISYNNIWYVLQKHTSRKRLTGILKELEKMVTTIEANRELIISSLDSDFKDFEDAIQHFSALSHDKITAIVTRNQSDFKHSQLPVLSPGEALGMIQSKI